MTPPTYRERRSPGLSATVWAADHAPGPTIVLPDGCMDLIWTGSALMVTGPDTEPFCFDGDGGRMVGLRFDPGVVPSLFDCAADELVNLRVDVSDLLAPGEARRWVAAVAESSTSGQAMVALVDARDRVRPAWTRLAVERLAAGASVASCASELGVTERTLHRKSLRHFGYGPKTLQRILRMQMARRRIAAGLPVGDVIERGGYADYPHMYREFVSLTGVGPVTRQSSVVSGPVGQ